MYSKTTPSLSHKRGGLRRVLVSQICTGSHLPPAGPYLTMGLSTDLNIFQKQDLDNNSECGDCECDSAYVKHRSESVFHKSNDGEISEMSILSRRHQ